MFFVRDHSHGVLCSSSQSRCSLFVTTVTVFFVRHHSHGVRDHSHGVLCSSPQSRCSLFVTTVTVFFVRHHSHGVLRSSPQSRCSLFVTTVTVFFVRDCLPHVSRARPLVPHGAELMVRPSLAQRRGSATLLLAVGRKETARMHNAREIIIINVWIRRQRGCITQGKLS